MPLPTHIIKNISAEMVKFIEWLKVYFSFSSSFVAVEEKKKNLKQHVSAKRNFSHSIGKWKIFLRPDETRHNLSDYETLFEAHQLRMKEEEKICLKIEFLTSQFFS